MGSALQPRVAARQPILSFASMTTRRFLQLDVFSPRAGAGNPLAVVLDADGLDDASMQAIARWTRLPETTFVFPPQAAGASYRLRMFSPQKEVPFAGHSASAPRMRCCRWAWPERLTVCWCRTALPARCRCASAVRVRNSASPSPRAQLAETAEACDPRLQAALRGWPLGSCRRRACRAGAAGGWVQVADEAVARPATRLDAVAALAESTDSMGVFAYAFSDGGEDSIWPCVPSSATVAASRTPRVRPMRCLPHGWTCATRCRVGGRRSKSARAAKSAMTRA